MSYTYRAIVGLGNPGPSYYKQRHSIGFRILDTLAEQEHISWQTKKDQERAAWYPQPDSPEHILLIKPTTFMNLSGAVIPELTKQGIRPEQILVVHDELELPFGKIAARQGGSHRGHNGLRSIIERIGPDFARLRFGISRPADRDAVPDYVLAPFQESPLEVEKAIQQAVDMIRASVQR